MNTTNTIGSKELAKIAGKRHDNVKRTIDFLVREGVIGQPHRVDDLASTAQGAKRSTVVYHVGQRDSYVIVAQLSPLFTGKLVDRWMALESGQAKPMGEIPDVRHFEARIAELEQEVKDADWQPVRDFCTYNLLDLTPQQRYSLAVLAGRKLKIATHREPLERPVGRAGTHLGCTGLLRYRLTCNPLLSLMTHGYRRRTIRASEKASRVA